MHECGILCFVRYEDFKSVTMGSAILLDVMLVDIY